MANSYGYSFLQGHSRIDEARTAGSMTAKIDHTNLRYGVIYVGTDELVSTLQILFWSIRLLYPENRTLLLILWTNVRIT